MIQEFFINLWTYISVNLYNRTIEIIYAPLNTTGMLWMLLPLLATLILMEFYFGRHKDEEFGWNTAFGNSLVLLFVAIDLFRHLYESSNETIIEFFTTSSDIKIIIPVIIFLLGFTLTFINFFHFLPKKVAYVLSSPPYINLIGLLGIIIVYSNNILIDITTILGCVVIFIFANLISLLLYYIIPSYTPPLQKILSVEDVEKFGETIKKKKNKEIKD